MDTDSVHAGVAMREPHAGLVSHLSRNAFEVPLKPNALLLDDACSGRQQLARDLMAWGFDVEATDDGEVGVELALRRQPTLIVLELRMRAGAGLDLLAHLRPRLPGAQLVVLTNYGSVASAVRAMRLGATNYLCKPAGLTELLRAIDQPAFDPASPEDLKRGYPALTLDEAIWEYIHRTIEDAGSLSEAARRLGLWRQSLKRMITKYRPAGARPIMESPRRAEKASAY